MAPVKDKAKQKSGMPKKKGIKMDVPSANSNMGGSSVKTKSKAPNWFALSPSRSRTGTKNGEQVSTENKGGGTGMSVKKKSGNTEVSTKNKKKTPKSAPKYCFPIGEIVEGVNRYKVDLQIRKSLKPLEIDVYNVHDEEITDGGDLLRMKTSIVEFQVLKTEAMILRRLEKVPGDKGFLSMSEYGAIPKHNLEFLIIAPYGATLHEIVRKIMGGTSLSIECGVAVALQMLKAIRDLHSVGYIHRNIRPSAFVCGLGNDETKIFLQDFRHVRKFDPKKPAPPRSSVKMYGSLRYSSRAAQNLKDQGRKDDLESFVYTIFSLMDKDSLSWKAMSSEAVVKEKDLFMANNGKDQYAHVPRPFAAIVAPIANMEFQTEPDYDSLKNVLIEIQNQQKLDPKACDWKGKPGLNEIEGDTNRSIDCKVTGERDAQLKASARDKKKKPTRKKLSSGDVIMGVGAQHGWKVINLLGSGGFGDVYKVHRDNLPPTKCYALKTESEDGEKRYLRLKVEVQVMMKTAEHKKEQKFEHFIEFVDRGKCEDLKCKYVVMGLVGPSLEDIRRKYLCTESFSKHTAFNVAIQTVQAVKDLHSIGYLHRDIKPANYAVGLGEGESTVYMLDFGIAKLFVDANNNHKVKRKKVKFLGTMRFACRACMMQLEQGRKDDLETWLYMVFDLIDGKHGMPWRSMDTPREILDEKKAFFNRRSESDFPNKILGRLLPIVQYIASLVYESTPDYDYIIDFFKALGKEIGVKLTKELDWLGRLNKKEFESESEKSEKKRESGDDDE